MIDEPEHRHLDAGDIAAWVDGQVRGAERVAIESHLAACAACRAELADVARIMHAVPGERVTSRRVWIPAVAAAVLLLSIAPRVVRTPDARHREAPGAPGATPRPRAPAGVVDAATELAWSPLPGADRYRVRLFDSTGTVLWEAETSDTVRALPSSLRLRRQAPYFWRVEAVTGYDRGVSSELVEFKVGGSP